MKRLFSGRILAVAIVAVMSSLLLFSQQPVGRAGENARVHKKSDSSAVAEASPIVSKQNKEEDQDSLVTLLSARSMAILDSKGVSYRRVIGPARFLHNNTYLICDTALWNTSTDEIEAMGHVKILQEQTVLSGDRLKYYVNLDLAQFRGHVVQLENKDKNMLRTRFLDYNTKDSVAIFQDGGAMKDKDGQIIESRRGTYDSKIKTFTFTDNVNMFTDSTFIKTTQMVYDTDMNLATFGHQTDIWHDEYMLSSNAGWYNRNSQVFFFNDRVHGMSTDKEAWADSLYYYSVVNDVEMLGHVQLTDTLRRVSALAGKVVYTDSLKQVFLTRDAAIAGRSSSAADADTIYFGADSIYYWSVERWQIDSAEIKVAAKRLEDMATDAVAAYRKKAAEDAAARAAEAEKNNVDKQAELAAAKAREQRAAKKAAAENGDAEKSKDASAGADSGADKSADSGKAAAKKRTAAGADAVFNSDDGKLDSESGTGEVDSLSKVGLDTLAAGAQGVADSLSIAGADSLSAGGQDVMDSLKTAILSHEDSLAIAVRDSLALRDSIARADSIAFANRDTSKVGFARAQSRVKIFRKDIQVICDSLEFNELDSLARLYKSPMVWNEANRQYAADSIYVITDDGHLKKASLMSSAFIIVEEAPDLYDQIRSTEMLAYFDSTGALARFDALGDANTIFYLKEDSTYATVNKSQAKMLSANFLAGDIDKIFYYDETQIDAYPLAQMRPDDRELKGFNWSPDARPSGLESITHFTLRESEMSKYSSRPKATFKETDVYYPGYMSGVYDEIKKGKERKRVADERKKAQEDSVAALPPHVDSLSAVAKSDSLALADSLKTGADSLAVVDSLKAGVDSLVAVSDSLGAAVDTVAAPTQKEIKAAERKAAREVKIAAREAKWARLDSLDAAKLQAKLDAKAAKKRDKVRKVLNDRHKKELKEQAVLDAYIEKYQSKKAREDAKAAAKASKEAAKPDEESAETAVDSAKASAAVEVREAAESESRSSVTEQATEPKSVGSEGKADALAVPSGELKIEETKANAEE